MGFPLNRCSRPCQRGEHARVPRPGSDGTAPNLNRFKASCIPTPAADIIATVEPGPTSTPRHSIRRRSKPQPSHTSPGHAAAITRCAAATKTTNVRTHTLCSRSDYAGDVHRKSGTRRDFVALPVARFARFLWLLAATLLIGSASFTVPVARAGGVTIITHGFNGNVTDWIIPMANKIPGYGAFPGSNYSCYQITVTKSGSFSAAQTFLGGVAPTASDSGEILIKLDWSAVAGAFQATTTDIANTVAPVLLATNFIPQLGGRSLAQFPIHLVGHSRGGSVVTELARLLGASGVWVDHVTTLDPHPVSLFSDAAIKNYANVLFADNYWQNLGDNLSVPNGEVVSGAYNRQLTNLAGGYSSTHSDTHLWYHGTLDWAVPTSDGTNGASITATERTNWWTATEAAGHATGFLWTLIGGGNRLTNLEPAGAGAGRISDGYNKKWDIGGGVAANRTALPANSGAWPNLLKFNLLATNPLPIGQSVSAKFYHQFGATTSVTATVSVFLDGDANPLNGNEILLTQTNVAGTGTNAVANTTLALAANPTNTPPGNYALVARISDGTRTRYLYAPEKLTLKPSTQLPVLVGSSLQILGGQVQFTLQGFPGQQVLTQASTNLADWLPVATNNFSATLLNIVAGDTATWNRRFYRTLLVTNTP